MNTLKLNSRISAIFNIFSELGYECFAVGGCIRDSILGINPKDIDFCTNATTEDMKKVFEQIKSTADSDLSDVEVIPTGEKFGTLTLRFNKFDENYEITSYRCEGRYEDGRHPSEIHFSNSIEEDLKRRDFTCNAIAWNPSVGFVDPFNGIQDIAYGVIRCVGNPEERFTEDALRIIRMVRFSIKYNFKIEENTYKAAKKLINSVSNISKERIGSEITQIFSYDLSNIDNLCVRNILTDILELLVVKLDIYSTLNSTSVEERFFHLVSYKSIEHAKRIMNVLALGSKIVDFVIDVRKAIDEQRDISNVAEKRTALRHIHNEREFKLLIKIMKQYYNVDVYDAFITPYVCEEPYMISHLAINGNDIMSEFNVKGEEVGRLLNSALIFVCHNPNYNCKDKIIKYLRTVEVND